MNASTELNPGMDMLIEHMRRQAECITDLKGIVDELKTENKMLKQQHLEEIQTYKETLDEHFHHYDNLKAENKQLKEDLAVPELDEENPLEYMIFELVAYLKDNEGNIVADVEEGEEIGPVIGNFDDIVGKIIWNSKAAKNAHTRTSQQLLAKIKALAAGAAPSAGSDW